MQNVNQKNCSKNTFEVIKMIFFFLNVNGNEYTHIFHLGPKAEAVQFSSSALFAAKICC